MKTLLLFRNRITTATQNARIWEETALDFFERRFPGPVYVLPHIYDLPDTAEEVGCNCQF